MKVTVYVPKQIHLPDSELPRLVELAKRHRWRYCRTHRYRHSVREFPIRVDEIIWQAVRIGILKLSDYVTNSDDERVYHKGQIRDRFEVWEEERQKKKE